MPIAPSPRDRITSPYLDAVSTASFATSPSPNAREWMKNATGMAGSPGNLISLSGESPPTAPSSYTPSSFEDTRGMSSGWSSPRPPSNLYAASVSPPTAGRRPMSFHMARSPAELHGHLGEPSSRRSSMHSHFARAGNPPLPHQPQPHFYAAPDFNLDTQRHDGIKAGERGYFFGYDTIASPTVDHVMRSDKVVLAGYEGGLEVHKLTKGGRLEAFASLKGLRGGVYHAKVLPWTAAQADVFPLIAVVVHGPDLPPVQSAPGLAPKTGGDYDAVSEDRSEAMANVPLDAPKDTPSDRAVPGFIECYQTTVEVYSLRTNKLVDILLEAPKVPLKTSVLSPIFQAPLPSGAFHIHADGGSIVVSSGVTGECWVYQQVITDESAPRFVCHGKLWTTLQQTPRGSEGSQDMSQNYTPLPPRPRPQTAILSVKGKWIAYCPATPSSQISLRATVPVPIYGRAPNLSSLTPGQLPPASSEIDLPLGDSVVNKIVRDATQELIQGAKWVGKQGWQAWNSYWNPQTNSSSRSPVLAPQSWGGSAQPDPSQFPPTHGAVTPPVAKDPNMISIVDLETLSSSATIHPVTTFHLHSGCSFLSFSPSGLSLFTASCKGDVQTVWDLMRLQYTKSSPLQGAGLSAMGGPRVRQVAQFSRMTVTRVVDVAWTKPNGERIAMVTERGTVHILDLPTSAFTWPPPRRRMRQTEATNSISEGTSAVAIASNALSSVREVARPLISRPRRTSSNGQLVGSGIGEYATHGGKVLAASISHSLGKTGHAISQLRHTGENRVSLPSSHSPPGPSCVTWVTGKRGHLMYVLGNGLVRSFAVTNRRATGGEKRAPRLSRCKDVKVPLMPDLSLAPRAKAFLDQEEYYEFTERDFELGNETMVLDRHRARAKAKNFAARSSIPQAEIESSAPYQPFHTDRRVALFEIEDGWGAERLSDLMGAASLDDEPSQKKKEGSKSGAPKAWAFGGSIPGRKLDLGLHQLGDDDFVFNDDLRALPASAMERVLERDGNNDQVVVTTRRKRGVSRLTAQDYDGFFEDDCEVLDFADQRV
ncbi:hypothetical protein B0T20DRAFT_365431 [Sordaria brevicollis]|uniref:Uncharacterized protein n=1 Tax=Sordaria brevicollis TaxID=83679 RepID=A0AAE0U2I4_SORBR|nr:hypothetical protein B0T20DRAFT_365431 [Sordaria brevicollis]